MYLAIAWMVVCDASHFSVHDRVMIQDAINFAASVLKPAAGNVVTKYFRSLVTFCLARTVAC